MRNGCFVATRAELETLQADIALYGHDLTTLEDTEQAQAQSDVIATEILQMVHHLRPPARQILEEGVSKRVFVINHQTALQLRDAWEQFPPYREELDAEVRGQRPMAEGMVVGEGRFIILDEARTGWGDLSRYNQFEFLGEALKQYPNADMDDPKLINAAIEIYAAQSRLTTLTEELLHLVGNPLPPVVSEVMTRYYKVALLFRLFDRYEWSHIPDELDRACYEYCRGWISAIEQDRKTQGKSLFERIAFGTLEGSGVSDAERQQIIEFIHRDMAQAFASYLPLPPEE